MISGKRWLLWGIRAIAVLAALCLLAWVGLYLLTERLRQGDVLPESALSALPPGNADEGQRLARLLGCSGCHGLALEGKVFADIPHVARLIAPNLTVARDRYDQPAFLRLMRAGTKPDGQLALVMPNKAHQRLADQELADLWAHLWAAPRVEDTLPSTRLHTLGRIGLLTGEFDIEEMRADAPESAPVLAGRNDPDRGRHLLMVACGECHGVDLAGYAPDAIPPLQILQAYSIEQFRRLMREGLTLVGTDSATGFMSGVARFRFTVLSDDEIADMKRYIDTL